MTTFTMAGIIAQLDRATLITKGLGVEKRGMYIQLADFLEEGRHEPLGSCVRDGGVNFAVFSAHAHKIELCLFDAQGRLRLALRHTQPTEDYVADLRLLMRE